MHYNRNIWRLWRKYGNELIHDPSRSNLMAEMMLPTGHDIDDLYVIMKSDGEWLRHGSYLHRPLSAVLLLSSGTAKVPIGLEGYAEWRTEPEVAASALQFHEDNRATNPNLPVTATPLPLIQDKERYCHAKSHVLQTRGKRDG